MRYFLKICLKIKLDIINLILNIIGHTQNKYEFLTFYVHLLNIVILTSFDNIVFVHIYSSNHNM